MNNVLNFSTNWNQKLNCTCFTTIRITNYPVGSIMHVVPNKSVGIKPFAVSIVVCKQFHLDALTDGVAYIDTSYSAETVRKIMQTMYSKKFPNWKDMPYYLLILKKIPAQNIDFPT